MANSFKDDGDKGRWKGGWRKWDKGALRPGRERRESEEKYLLRYEMHMKEWEKHFMLACRYIIEVYKWWVGELNYNPVFNLQKQRNPPAKHGEHWGN